MAHQLSDIRTRVQNKIDDTDFSASLIDQFINDTQRDIFNSYEYPFNQATDDTITLAINTNTITLPTDFQAMKVLEVIAPENEETDLTRFFMNFISFKAIYPDVDNESTGYPSFWTIFGDTVEFAWNADKEYTMRMYYLKDAVELVNDTDVPEVPAAFSELLVQGAYIRALEHNDDNDIADYNRTRYFVPQLQAMVSRYNPRLFGKQQRMRNSRRRI